MIEPSQNLERSERVPLREVWPHEAHDWMNEVTDGSVAFFGLEAFVRQPVALRKS